MQDVVGTAQGNWFLPGRQSDGVGFLDGHLALVHDYIGDADQPLLVVGTGVPGLRSGQYSFGPASAGVANRDWSAVTADGRVHCYGAWRSGRTRGGLPLSTPNGVVLIEMPASDRLRIGFVPGPTACPVAPTLTGAAALFER